MADEPATRELDLEDREVRVLGCLIEKELSTPDYYPMTINALTTACNQKTNREPVVEYSETDIVKALDGLHRKRLIGNASAAHSRAPKYRHALAEAMGLHPRHLAVVASLMLRGPETTGEVRARTSRMHDFESLDEVDAVLDELQDWDPPLVTEMPRRRGQKEARFAHLMAGEPDLEADEGPALESGTADVDELAAEVAQLKEALRNLTERFETFRSQFE